MARNANSPRSLPPKVTCADPARSISSHSSISVIRHRPVKIPAKLGARLVMSPDQLRQSDQIACGRRKGQRPIVDEVNKLGRFDAEIHMRTSVSALAELMVRIHSPPATSQQQTRFRHLRHGGFGGAIVAQGFAVPFTLANPLRRDSTRNSIRCKHSARPARPSSPASATKAGCAGSQGMMTAGSPARRWVGRLCG